MEGRGRGEGENGKKEVPKPPLHSSYSHLPLCKFLLGSTRRDPTLPSGASSQDSPKFYLARVMRPSQRAAYPSQSVGAREGPNDKNQKQHSITQNMFIKQIISILPKYRGFKDPLKKLECFSELLGRLYGPAKLGL